MIKRKCYFLVLFVLIITSFSIRSQNEQTFDNNDQYWFLHKNDSLLGVNYIELNKKIRSENRTPKKNIIVSIIDAGFDFNHVALKDIVWINKNEISANNTDDDLNGYVDDINGWNFLGNSSGENLQKVATAAFREYKHLREKFINKDTTLLTKEEKKEYSHYKKMRTEAKLDNYILFERYLADVNDMYVLSDSLMTEHYGDKETTLKDFFNIEVKDTTGVMETLTSVALSVSVFPKDRLWSEVVEENKSKYELAHNRIKSLDDFTDDPHLKIGNAPNSFQNFKYGNNHIHIDPYHGTMVAGLVAQANNIALADIEIMGIRAVPDGDEYDKDIVAAIRYAVDNGAKVINMSFGKEHSLHREEVETAIQYAQEKDVLILKAAGNKGFNTDIKTIYPEAVDSSGDYFDNLIVVGSSLKNGTLASFSNYGVKTVDILAPGEDIKSTSPNDNFDIQRGTSLSTPLVTGIAAMIRSYFPDLTAAQVKEILIKSSTDIANMETELPGKEKKSTTIKYTNRAGGIVNAFNAFNEANKLSSYGF